MTRAWFDHAISTLPQSAKHWNLQSLASSHCGLTPSPECGIRNLLRMVKLWLVAEKIIALHGIDIEYIEYSDSDKLKINTHWVDLGRPHISSESESLHNQAVAQWPQWIQIHQIHQIRRPQASAGVRRIQGQNRVGQKAQNLNGPPMDQSCKKGDQHGSEMVSGHNGIIYITCNALIRMQDYNISYSFIFHLSFLLVFASQGLAFERFSKVSLTLSLLSLAVSSIASVRRIQIQTHHVEVFVVGRMPQLVAYEAWSRGSGSWELIQLRRNEGKET